MIQLWGVATYANEYYYHWRHAAEHYGWNDVKIIGMGEPWTGFLGFQRMVLDALKEAEDDKQIVLLVDVFDALVQAPPEHVEKLFRYHFSAPVVFGAEKRCAANCYAQASMRCRKSKEWYINGGVLLGRIKDLKPLFQFGVDNKIEDSQVAAAKYWEQHCDRIELDIEERLAYNQYTGMAAVARDGRMWNPRSGIFAAVHHLPGQPYDFGVRSRYMRSTVLPNVRPMGTLGVFDEAAHHFYKNVLIPTTYRVYWIPVAVLLFMLVVVLPVAVVSIRRCRRE